MADVNRRPAGREITQTPKGLRVRENPKTKDGEINVSFARTYSAQTNAIADMLEDKVANQNEKIGESIGDMLAMRASLLENSSPSLDLSAIASLVDARTGSEFARKYVPPKQHKENMVLADKLTEKIGLAKERIKANEVGLYQQKLKNRIALEKAVADRELKATLAAEAAGIKRRTMDKAPPDLVKKVAEFEGVINMADDARDLVEKHRDLFGPLSDIDLRNRFQAFFPNEKAANAAQMRQIIKARLIQLISNVAKEQQGGRLSDKDIEMYAKVVGNLSDHPDTVKQRITELAIQAERARNAAIDSWEFGGYGTGRLREMSQRRTKKKKAAPVPQLFDWKSANKDEKMKFIERIRQSRKNK